MKNLENNRSYSNDKVKNYEKKSYKEMSHVRENNNRPTKENDYSKYADYKEQHDNTTNPVKQETEVHEVNKSVKLVNSIKPLFIPTAIITVAATYGVGFLTPADSVVKDMNLLIMDNTLVVEVDFDTYNADEKLSIQVINDFTNRIEEIDNDLIEPDQLIYKTSIEDLRDNATYQVKIVDDKANLIFSKSVTFGELRSRSQIGEVYLFGERDSIMFSGSFEVFDEKEDFQVIIKQDEQYWYYNLLDYLEHHNEQEMEDKTFFYGTLNDFEEGTYDFYITTKKDTLYSSSVTIESQLNSVLDEMYFAPDGEIYYAYMTFSNYDSNDGLYLLVTGDNYQEEYELMDFYEEQNHTSCEAQIVNLLPGNEYEVTLTNGKKNLYKTFLRTEDIGNNPLTILTNLEVNSAESVIDIDMVYEAYEETESNYLKVYGNDFEQIYQVNDYIEHTSDGSFFHLTIEEGIEIGSVYTIEIYNGEDLIEQRIVTLERKVNSILSTFTIEQYNGKTLDYKDIQVYGEYEIYDRNDEITLQLYDSSGTLVQEESLVEYTTYNPSDEDQIYYFGYDVKDLEANNNYTVKLVSGIKVIREEEIEITRASFTTNVTDLSLSTEGNTVIYLVTLSDYDPNERFMINFEGNQQNYNDSLNDVIQTADGYNCEGSIDLEYGTSYIVTITDGTTAIYTTNVETEIYVNSVVESLTAEGSSGTIIINVNFSSYDESEDLIVVVHNDNTDETYQISDYIQNVEDEPMAVIEAIGFTDGETYEVSVKLGNTVLETTSVTLEYIPVTNVVSLEKNIELDEEAVAEVRKNLILSGTLSPYESSEEVKIRITNLNDENDIREIFLAEYITDNGNDEYSYEVTFENVSLDTSYIIQVLVGQTSIYDDQVEVTGGV